MSDDFTENEDDAWEDVALRRVFLECLAPSSSSSSLSSLPSTTSKVYVSTLVDYIRENASGDYRNEALLDELQAAIEDVASDGQVDWALFKKASRRWVHKVRCDRWQDGNNNIEKDDSKSDDERGSSGVESGGSREFCSLGDHNRKPKTPRRFVSADFVNLSNVSSYSPSSDTTHGCAMSTDTTPESADDTDVGSGSCGEVAQVDLRLRVRRFDEENALLREELVRTEELSAGFQRQFENLRRKLDQTNDKCRQLERENDEHKEILHEVEQKEKHCRWALQKAEKERALLGRQLEEAEAERQQITGLASKLELCKKEKQDCVREAVVCRQELEERQTECEMLREKLAQIASTNDSLQESYEKTMRHLREQNQELKNQIFDLQSKQNAESLTDISSTQVSLSPASSYLHCYTPSTPYSGNRNVQRQDSLYAELKASGFPVEDTANDSKVRELEEELSWYNEEIRDAVIQLDRVLEQLNRQRRTPHVPDLSLDGSTDVKTADIYELLQKISKLSNAVNEIIWKPKVKDASSQVCVDTAAYAEQRMCSQYGITSFDDSLRLASENRGRETDGLGEANERRESGFFVEAYSMNSRLLGEYVEEVEVASTATSYRETDAISPSRKGSMTAPLGIQEHTIIDPIVEELDRILQCTNQCDETAPLALSTNCSPSKNPKFRCIFTCAQPAPEQRAPEANYSVTESTLSSPKRLERDLAATYVISSGGDAPPLGMVNNKSFTNGDNTERRVDSMLETIPRDDSSTCGADSLSAPMLKTQDVDITGLNESETLPEQTFDNTTRDSKSSGENLSSLSPSSTPAKPVTPRKVNDPSVAREENTPSANGVTHSVTPNKIVRNFPNRKISVFHRSFDIDTLHAIGEAGGPDTYRLTERSMSTPDAKQGKQQTDDRMEIDLDCMKKTPVTRAFLLNTYRTNANDSDSSDCQSPETSLDHRRDGDPSITEPPTRAITRPIVFAPKLKLPLLNDAVRFANAEKKPAESSNGDSKTEVNERPPESEVDKCNADLTANDTHKTYDVSTSVDKYEADSSQTSEMIRPGDEVEKGITYRRGSFSELDFSAYSLLSSTEKPIENPRDARGDSIPTVVLSSDGESTSCDSSPKREAPFVRALLPLRSTYERPINGQRAAYAPQDPTKSRGSRSLDRATDVGIGGYQTRNDSISIISSSGVGSYGGGGGGGGGSGGGGIRAPDEKASVVPAVALAMSSGEDSSDSECDPMAIRGGDVDENRRNVDVVVDETRSISPAVFPFVNGAFLGSSTPAPTPAVKCDSPHEQRGDGGPRKPVAQKRDKRERIHTIRRSLSEGGCGRAESSCPCTTSNSVPAEFNKEETQPNAFPSLGNARLQESGIANLSSSDEIGGSLSEADLERKYTALSVGLVTDRVTLPRRVALSIRQRDQSERNLACEVQKMHQDIQDGVRQRNSVSGRVTLRRPSLSAETQKWEVDKLDRTDSSSSIGELREIFEQAESRRNSREENNNVFRLHSSNLSIRDSDNGEGDVWTNPREEPFVELPTTVNGCQESRTGRRTPQPWTMHITNVPWKPMLWCILVSFFLGFYMKHVVSSVNECSGTPHRWWSIQEIFERYADPKTDARRPI